MRNILTIVALLTGMLFPAFVPCEAQWVKTNLYVYETVECFAAHDSILFAGTSSGGIYKSLDSGDHWVPSSNGLPPNDYIQALAVNGATIFAATEDSSVYRSLDNGASWMPAHEKLIPPGDYSDYVYGLFSDDGFIFATTGEGVYSSSDQGISWSQRDTGIANPQFADFQAFCNNSGYLFAGGNNCLFRSSDEGSTWILADSGLTSPIAVRTLIALGDTIIAGTSDGIYLSTNNGNYWISVNSTIPLDSRINCFCVANSGGTAMIFAGTASGIYLSSDSGRNWTDMNSGLPLDRRVNSLIKIGNRLLTGTAYNGVFTSTDLGVTWETSNTGLPIISPSILSLLSTQTSVYAGGSGVFRTTDDGAHWYSIGAQVSSQTNALALSGQNLLAGTNAGLYLSTNAGESWKLTLTQPIYYLATKGDDVFAGVYGGAYRSTNSGVDWTVMSSNIFASLDGAGPPVAVNDSFLFLGTGDVFDQGGMFRSSDDGTTWNTDESGINYWYSVSNIVVEKGDSALSGNIFAAMDPSILRSTNNGGVWDTLNTGLDLTEDPYINALAADDSILFAGITEAVGGSDGVLLSMDNGTSWKWDNNGLLSNPQIEAFTFKDTTVFAGSYAGGVWKRSGVQPFNLPSESVTHPTLINSKLDIFPNPCTQSTSINFHTPEGGIADIRIINSLGIEIVNVFSGWIEPGEHSWKWVRSAGLPPGTYECIVRFNEKVFCSLVIVE